MAISCGFYNSVNHDRVYDAVQFGEMFDGLITDGVYETVGNRMMVSVVSGMTIRVGSGRAWFNKTWTVNTGDYPLTIPAADVLLPRIDAVVLEIDTRLAARDNTIKIISGRSASNPSKPTLTRANGLYQYPLAWVTVPANARSLTAGNIENQVGRSPTPFVTGVVNQTSISDLWNKWDKEFQDWFDEVKDTLNNTGGNLTSLTSRVSSLESKLSNTQNDINGINKSIEKLSSPWFPIVLTASRKLKTDSYPDEEFGLDEGNYAGIIAKMIPYFIGDFAAASIGLLSQLHTYVMDIGYLFTYVDPIGDLTTLTKNNLKIISGYFGGSNGHAYIRYVPQNSNKVVSIETSDYRNNPIYPLTDIRILSSGTRNEKHYFYYPILQLGARMTNDGVWNADFFLDGTYKIYIGPTKETLSEYE